MSRAGAGFPPRPRRCGGRACRHRRPRLDLHAPRRRHGYRHEHGHGRRHDAHAVDPRHFPRDARHVDRDDDGDDAPERGADDPSLCHDQSEALGNRYPVRDRPFRPRLLGPLGRIQHRGHGRTMGTGTCKAAVCDHGDRQHPPGVGREERSAPSVWGCGMGFFASAAAGP